VTNHLSTGPAQSTIVGKVVAITKSTKSVCPLVPLSDVVVTRNFDAKGHRNTYSISIKVYETKSGPSRSRTVPKASSSGKLTRFPVLPQTETQGRQ
jgi:hypothetical protein